MKVYLKNRETNEILNEYINVIFWGEDFVEYDNNGRCKIYCDIETEYFTDIDEEEPEPVLVEVE